MTNAQSLEDIERLYATRGGLHYGEGVTQMEHALQCAAWREAEGCAAQPDRRRTACMTSAICSKKKRTWRKAGSMTVTKPSAPGCWQVLFPEAV